MAEVNPLSNLSYTNKDFQDIYPELLNLSKKISYKWDPTVSNESDPGVLLLKLCAIIADKNNYNIDKNVLETFPLSVTQETNARQLFEQLGYRMRWYRGATATVAMRWVGDIEENTPDIYPIEVFTMVADSGNEVVYTLTSPVSLSQNGTTAQASAIQGVATKYTINGETKITPNLLDSQNRLYFVDKNIAENGIFIENADGTMGTESDIMYYHGWKQVDNLAVEPLGKTIYKFGVTRDGKTCYIEFPDDAEELIGQGIYITYIKTDGRYGNISSKILTKFYNDVSVTSEFGKKLALNSENVQLTNINSSSDGFDPESINSAYRNYQKTIGTFNTLVTCRDYTNAINNAGFISNGFVCDRTNDVQCSYNIMSFDGDLTKRILSVEKEISPTDAEPYMDAFDLKIYALQYVSDPSTNAKSYNATFDVLVNSKNKTDENTINTIDYINDVKSIQHDFIPFLNKRLCMIKNKYPIDCKIIPQQKITATQERSIITNILKALYGALNSQDISFGEEISYDFVYNIISKADERIKSVVLDVFNYSTYAVYTDGNFFKEININTFTDEVCGYYNENDGLFYYDDDFTEQIPFIEWQEDATYIAQGEALNITGETPPYPATWANLHHFYNTIDEKSWTPIISEKVFADISETDASKDKTYKCGVSSFIEDTTSEIQNDIYAKSVLNGNTQLLAPDETFDYSLTQKCKEVVNNIEYISTNTDIYFKDSPSPTYTIKDNEHIYLYAPNLIDVTSYSTYVKFQYKIDNDIELDSDYQLGSTESITFYWKSTEGESAYRYYKYGSGTIIHPSFKIYASESASGNYVGGFLDEGSGTVPSGGTITIGTRTYTYNEYLQQMTASSNILSTIKTINIRKINEVTLSSSTPCFWITNTKKDDECYLFKGGDSSRLLQPGEYFFYAALDSSDLTILGAGTQITRSNNSNDWAVSVIDYSDIVENGADAFEDIWFYIPDNETMNIKEMQFISLNAGTTFKISSTDSTNVNLLFNNQGIFTQNGSASYDSPVVNLNDYTLSYDDGTGTETSIPQIIIGNIGWSGKTFLSLNLSSSVPQTLETNQTIDYKTADSATYSTIHDDTEKLYVLSDFTYSLDGGVDIDVTRLDLYGNTYYMQLYVYYSTKDTESGNFTYSADESIYIKIEATDDQNTVWESADDDYDYISQLYGWKQDDVYSNTGIELVGSGVSPITLGITPESTSQHYYNSTDSKSWTASTVATKYTTAGQTPTSMSLIPTVGALAFNTADTKAWKAMSTVTHNLEFLLPAGQYIVPIFLSEDFNFVEATLVTVMTDTSTVEQSMYPINSSSSDISNKGIHYMQMNLTELYATYNNIDHFEIILTVKIEKDVHKVTVLPILKYVLPINGYTESGEPIYMDKGTYQAVLHHLMNLDTENKFDYTYVVDDDELVLNPLDAKSFFNEHHILNKYTISQLDTANTRTYITSKLK